MGIFDASQTQTGEPWAPLRDPTIYGTDQARQIYDRGVYGGQWTAPINQWQQQSMQQGYNAAGAAGNVGQAYGNAGQQMLGGLNSAFGYNQQALQGSLNPWLTNPAQYLGLANQTANDPYLTGQIDAALRDPFRQLTEQQMPGIGRGYNMGGSGSGSRRQIAEGIAQRGYADRATDTAAQMRGQAYGQGLGFANQAAGNDYQAQQQAAANLGNFGNQGLSYLGQQYGYGQQGANDQFKWGTQDQDLQNQQIQASMNQFNAPWANLQSYGSYINPLAQNMQSRTVDKDMLGAYLMQGLGGMAGSAGGAIGNGIEDWLFGAAPANGGARPGGAWGDFTSWAGGLFEDND